MKGHTMLGYQVKHVGFCGMETFREDCETLEEAQACIAGKLAKYQKDGFPVSQVDGETWEIEEPDDCAMVPDDAGFLYLKRIAGECGECGCECDTDHRVCQGCLEAEEQTFYCDDGLESFED